MYNATQVIQSMQEQGLTQYQQFAHAYEAVGMKMSYFMLVLTGLLLIVIGLIVRVTKRNGSRSMLLLQPNYYLTITIVMLVLILVVVLTQYFPIIPYLMEGGS